MKLHLIWNDFISFKQKLIMMVMATDNENDDDDDDDDDDITNKHFVD